MLRKPRLLFLFLLVMATSLSLVFGQEEGEPVEKQFFELENRRIEEATWEKATSNLDYSADKREQQTEETKSRIPDLPEVNFSAIGKFIQILSILIVLGLLGYWIAQLYNNPSNSKINQQAAYHTLETVEDELMAANLQDLLSKTLANGDYSGAVRVQYLRLIQTLGKKKHITWAKEKTNRQYLNELSETRLVGDFKAQTRIYEQVWYGQKKLTQNEYDRLAPGFESLIKTI